MRHSSILITKQSNPPLAHLISLPLRRKDATPYPVLCFLHGHGEAAPMPIRDALTLHGPLRPENSSRIAERFIIVAPQLRVAGDNWRKETDAVRRIVGSVLDECVGDPQRTYLTGFSYGGNGVFDLAIAQRDLWAAAWAVDPTRPPRGDLPCPLWLSLGEASRARGDDFVRAIKGLQEVRPEEGIPEADFVREDRGENHTGTARIAYREDRVYEWMLRKTRTG
jgi:predicted peptidase